MTVMITGAAGFVGLNLLQHLLLTYPDARIIAVDQPSTRHDFFAVLSKGALPKIAFAELDLRDRVACNALLTNTQPTHILHAAAITEGSRSAMFDVNADGTRNLLEGAAAAGSVTRCVQLSSSGLYSQREGEAACDENHPLDLSTPYAQSKYYAECAADEIAQTGRMQVVTARLAPVYGPHEESRTHRPRVSLVQHLLRALLTGQELTIAGDDMHRDWTHSADIARALCGLLFAPDLPHRLYNVSAGKSISARALIQIFVEHGLQVRFSADSSTADVVLAAQESRKALLCARLADDTGFAPQFDIYTGVVNLIQSQQ